MSGPFVCPFCWAVSCLPGDIAERYCGRCHVFVDDVLSASPLVRMTMVKFLRRLAERQPESRDAILRTAEAWEHGKLP